MKPTAWFVISLTLLTGNAAWAQDQQSDRVQNGTFQVPAWIISQPSTTPTPNTAQAIFPTSPLPSGAFPSTVFGAAGPYAGSLFSSNYGGYGLGGLPGLGFSGFPSWTASPYALSGGIPYGGGYGGWGNRPGWGGGMGVPGFGGYGLGWGAPGLGGIGYSGGWGGWGAPGLGGGYGLGGMGSGLGYGGMGYGWGGFSPAGSAMFMGAFGASMMSKGEDSGFAHQRVVQTGPSPSSGNYYQPASVNPTASGSYYASTGSAMYPAAPASSQPKDYWGTMGNPFGGNLNSTPWSK